MGQHDDGAALGTISAVYPTCTWVAHVAGLESMLWCTSSSIQCMEHRGCKSAIRMLCHYSTCHMAHPRHALRGSQLHHACSVRQSFSNTLHHAGKRVSVTFPANELHSEMRTQHVCVHVIDPPNADTAASQSDRSHATQSPQAAAKLATSDAEAAQGWTAGNGGDVAQGASYEQQQAGFLDSKQEGAAAQEEEPEEEEEAVPVITFLHGYPTSSYDYAGVLDVLMHTPAADLLAAGVKGSEATAGQASETEGNDQPSTGGEQGATGEDQQPHAAGSSGQAAPTGLAALGCRLILIDLLGYGNRCAVLACCFTMQHGPLCLYGMWQ